MHPLGAAELLEVWEQGQGEAPLRQALRLLAVACPDSAAEALARLSIGRRDALLLQLRAWTFGPQLDNVADCPNCGRRLEFTLQCAELQQTGPDDAAPEILSVSAVGCEVRFRLPDSLDLMAVAGEAEPASARRALFDRCLVEVQPASDARLPPPVIDAVLQKMSEADPQANIRLALNCPDCAHRWEAAFDIASFFWAELDHWARHTLREVHGLASAYGWSERDILAMSAWRRRAYLGMASG